MVNNAELRLARCDPVPHIHRITITHDWLNKHRQPSGKLPVGTSPWANSPQFRLWLGTKDAAAQVHTEKKSVKILITLSTPINGVIPELRLVKNLICPSGHEKAEVMPARYQAVAAKSASAASNYTTETHEVFLEAKLDVKFALDSKIGSHKDFPFFIVASVKGKDIAGPFTLNVHSDKHVMLEHVLPVEQSIKH
mmetsp:Transcript_37041/g.44784  ORF Transcript_37041/g.44784 Transcript_37041/m.44784 type:complete len:195 (+) Transcript_37041:348-932(+)